MDRGVAKQEKADSSLTLGMTGFQNSTICAKHDVRAATESRLEGDVAVFFLGVGVALVFQGAEGRDDFGAGFGRFDYGVDVAAFGGHEGIGEAVAEFGDLFLT